MSTRDTSELKKTEEKPRSLWRSLVPGYEEEVIEKALKNPLLDFSGSQHYIGKQKKLWDKSSKK